MDEKVIQGIIGATIFVLISILITIIVIIKYYRSKVEQNNLLLHSIIKTQEDERRRVSMDIHDSLGGLLRTIKLNLDILQHLPELQNTEIGERISKNYGLISEAVAEARNASNALIPESIKKFGLKGAINDLVAEYSLHFNINLNNECPVNLGEIVQIQVYRILLELFNNSAKYANATQVELKIYESNKNLIVNYSDNGIGFSFDTNIIEGKGNGLKNIKSRVESLNGKLQFENVNGVSYKFIFKHQKQM